MSCKLSLFLCRLGVSRLWDIQCSVAQGLGPYGPGGLYLHINTSKDVTIRPE